MRLCHIAYGVLCPVLMFGCASTPPPSAQTQPTVGAPAAATSVAGAPAGVAGAGALTSQAGADATPSPPAADGGMASSDDAVERSCCEVQSEAGCAQTNVQGCVCDRVPSCCQSAWDIVCVQLVDALACASCKGPCCETGITTGCEDPDVESCVCDADPTCCSETWDDYCTVLVDSLGCGQCS